MRLEFTGTEIEALTRDQVRIHLATEVDDTTTFPDSQVDGWMATARQDCLNATGLLPAAQTVQIYWDRWPIGQRFLRTAGGQVDTATDVELHYLTEATPEAWTELAATEYYTLTPGPVSEIWLRESKTWPSATLVPRAAVRLSAKVQASSKLRALLRQAMLLKIGTWAANRGEEAEPLVPGAQVQKMIETAERIYSQISVLGCFTEDFERG